MSKMENIGFEKISSSALSKLDFNPFKKIGKEWFLVTAGNENGWNTMTASWGFSGVMWGKNTFTTVIRPQRHTKKFVDENDYFTICFFDDEKYRKALSFCGSHSGKDCDKAKETGLTPLFISDEAEAYGEKYSFETTGFEEASMILVCKKAYVQPMTGECMLNKTDDEKWFANKDHHIQYIGEIVSTYIKD